MADDERTAGWVEEAQAGDQGAFGSLVERFEGLVLNFVRDRVGQLTLAEDLTQETFLRAYRGIGQFDPRRASFHTWLVTIAHNLCVDHYRSCHLNEQEMERLKHQSRLASSGQELDGAEYEAIASRDAVVRLLARLSEDERNLLLMKYLSGLEYDEMAQVIGTGASTLRCKVHRIVRKLQGALVAPPPASRVE